MLGCPGPRTINARRKRNSGRLIGLLVRCKNHPGRIPFRTIYCSALPPTITSSTLVISAHSRPWLRWGSGIVLLLVVLAGVGLQYWLDPWLLRTLEQQVAEQSDNQYQLRVEVLHTHLWQRAVELRGVHLRSAAPSTAARAGLRLDVQRLSITGVGLLVLWRRGLVPVDSLVVAGLRLHLPAGAEGGPKSSAPHEQLPLGLAGIHLRQLVLERAQVLYQGPTLAAQLRRADLAAHDLLLSAAGAADTSRFLYARAWQLQIAQAEALVQQHQVTGQAIRFSTKARQLILDSVRIQPRAAQSAAAEANGKPQLTLSLPQFRLTGWQPAQLMRRQFRADSVVFAHPRVLFRLPAVPPPSLDKLLAPYLDYFQLGQFLVQDGTIALTGTRQQPVVQALQLQGHDLRVDAAGARDTTRILYAHAWEGSTGHGLLRLDAPYYYLAYKSLQLATREGLFQVKNIALAPTMSPTALARSKGHQAPHVSVRVPLLHVLGFNYAAFTRRGALLAREVELRRPFVITGGDGRFPLNPARSIATPDEIGKLAIRLDVRRLRLTDCTLYFTYLSSKTGQLSTMTLNRMQATITNVTNDPHRMTAAHPALVQASGWLQNQCRLQATFQVPLLDPNGTHRIVGTIGATPISLINSMTVPSQLIRFERGQVHGVRVRMLVNRQGVSGSMMARYSDLKLAFLHQKGDLFEKNLLSRIGSQVVNALVIRDENPRKGQLMTGTIQSRRNLQLSVFSLWRQGLVSGMLHSIGVPEKIAKSISEAE